MGKEPDGEGDGSTTAAHPPWTKLVALFVIGLFVLSTLVAAFLV